MGDFDNQVVIVTGGAIGMGGDTALEFARQGAKVTVADINRDAGSANVKRIVDRGFEGLFVEADVTLGPDCHRVVSETVAAFGGVDILFNNAGIQPPSAYLNVEDTPEELWDRILGVNLKSYFLMAKHDSLAKSLCRSNQNNRTLAWVQYTASVPCTTPTYGSAHMC